MGNKSIWIAGALMVFIGLLFASRVNEKNYPTKPTSTSSAVLAVATGIPLKHESDIIHKFITLVDSKKITEAVEMMSDEITQNEYIKQTWGIQFRAMKSVKVISIDTSLLEDWTNTRHTYQVTLDVKMDPSSVSGPIPYYGYENGTNIRFISLIKSGKNWKIEGIATGP